MQICIAINFHNYVYLQQSSFITVFFQLPYFINSSTEGQSDSHFDNTIFKHSLVGDIEHLKENVGYGNFPDVRWYSFYFLNQVTQHNVINFRVGLVYLSRASKIPSLANRIFLINYICCFENTKFAMLFRWNNLATSSIVIYSITTSFLINDIIIQ